ncbi:MAG: prefoldin subunit beta [Candidatus Hydrothermarchaeaceae archaeon]
MEQLSPQLRQQLAQFQAVQQQAQTLAVQRSQMEFQLKDLERTLELLDGTKEDAELYKSSGAILVRSEKGKLLEELKEKKDTLELRIKTLQKQEKRFEGKLKEMQEDIRKALSAAGAPGVGSAG